MGRMSLVLVRLTLPLTLLGVSAASPRAERIYKPEVCEPKFWAQSQTHTACLVVDGMPTELSSKDRRLVVELHNSYRGRVEQLPGQPAAADMQAMVWDDDLASLASRWVSQCSFEHDRGIDRSLPGAYEVGQNLAMGHSDWSEVVTQWWREGAAFAYGSRAAEGFNRQSTGHYVQVVWATASRVGCAAQSCPGGYFFACNYANAVGIGGQRWTPYQQGAKGSACPVFYNSTTGLCDCKGKICKNDGVLDVKTCQCRCSGRAPWLEHGDCAVNCRLAEDRKLCATQGGAWNAHHCQQYSNIKYEYCPIMCGLCPAVALRPGMAAAGLVASSVTSTTTASPSEEDDEDETDVEGDDAGAGESEADDTEADDAETEGEGETDGDASNNGNDEGDGDADEGGGTEEGGESHGDDKGDEEDEDYLQTELPRCAAVDDATCVQVATQLVGVSGANGSSGLERCQWPDHGCPAMCGQCAATMCKGSDGLPRFIGDTWLTSVGLHTCSEQGVSLSRGCITASRASIIPIGELKNDTWNGIVYGCVCRVISSTLKLSCTPLGRTAAAVPVRPSVSPDLSDSIAAAAAVASPAPATTMLQQQQPSHPAASVQPCLHKDPPFCGSAVFARMAPHVRCGRGTRCPAACGHCQSSDGSPSYSAFLSEPPFVTSTPADRLSPAGRMQYTGRGGRTPAAGSTTAAASAHAARTAADDDGDADESAAGVLVTTEPPLCSSGPEAARCGQPSARGFFLHAQCKHATVRLACPAMCGLCRAVHCLDYSGRTYSVGETWVSDFAQLQCTPAGVKAEKGCFYAQLRQFIPAGTAKNYTDGLLHYSCSCRVDDDETTLDCTRTLLVPGSAVQLSPASVRPPLHPPVVLTTYRTQPPGETSPDAKSPVSEPAAALGPLPMASPSSPVQLRPGVVPAAFQRPTQRLRGDRTTATVIVLQTSRAGSPIASVDVGSSLTTRSASSKQPSSLATKRSQPGLASSLPSKMFSPSSSEPGATDPQPSVTVPPTAVTSTPTALPPCSQAEEAKCGQPSSSGYYVAAQCRHPTVGRLCPAMCDKCQATACKDYMGGTHSVGRSWVAAGFGRITCTGRGVTVEDGCYFKSRDVFVPTSKSYEYAEHGAVLACLCERISSSQMRLSCKTKAT